jgi:hypothetical protein
LQTADASCQQPGVEPVRHFRVGFAQRFRVFASPAGKLASQLLEVFCSARIEPFNDLAPDRTLHLDDYGAVCKGAWQYSYTGQRNGTEGLKRSEVIVIAFASQDMATALVRRR